ncbi:pyridoxal phosphate-dependent decarboxylase family protein [Microvirga sp. M2]|uniref:pyridoxal phosphate-dependent decarboxylase family protein n=1 Tax=Microvirga sp. M2 TaxID=3073270 RepID=UPI0039C14E6F
MNSASVEAASLFEKVATYATRFRTSVGDRPQRPEATYREALQAFEAPTPESGTPADYVLSDLVTRASPGLHAMTGPRFYGWVIGASHPVGVAADWLTSVWGQNAGNHMAAPAAAAAETIAARWLLDLLDLPRQASVGFVTGATVANFVCLAAARGEVLRQVGWDVESNGLFGAPSISVLIGEEAHATVFSALQFLGLGHDRVIRVKADEAGRMIPPALAEALRNCSGPTIVILQAGQINTGACDAFPELIPVARAHGAWIHVDGAFGLWARACPARSNLVASIEHADSWASDGHKWLQTPYDSGYAIVRDAEAHRRAMTISASYPPPVSDGDRDPSHFVPELSRRARGFATWAMIRHLGREGIAAMVERHCRLARRIASGLASEPGVSVLNEVVLNQVIVSFGADASPEIGDNLTCRTMQRIQADGTCFMGGVQWRGRWVMRVSVISAQTTDADADQTILAVIRAWRAVQEEHGIQKSV